MASAEERKRSLALGALTRNLNKLTELINDKSPLVIVTPQFDRVMKCWENLEEAHDDFILTTDIADIDNDPKGVKYIDEPGTRHSAAVKKYSDYMKSEEKSAEEKRQQQVSSDHNVEVERSKRELQNSIEKQDSARVQELNARHVSAKEEVLAMIETFNRVNLKAADEVKDASDIDKRGKLNRLEVEFEVIKAKLINLRGIDPSKLMPDVSD